MDMEFGENKDKVALVKVNTTASREDVGELERQIRLIKERSRCSISDMSDCGVTYIPRQIVVHVVYNSCLWLNAFLSKKDLSIDFHPRELVIQRSVSYIKDCNAVIRACVEPITDKMVANNQSGRTQPFIGLSLSGN